MEKELLHALVRFFKHMYQDEDKWGTDWNTIVRPYIEEIEMVLGREFDPMEEEDFTAILMSYKGRNNG